MQEEWRGEIIHLTWLPRSFLLKAFLSDEECDHLIKLVRIVPNPEEARNVCFLLHFC
jgi:hypothetical protein